jgi:hypothetical protein
MIIIVIIKMSLPLVFFEIAARTRQEPSKELVLGKIVIQLRSDICPKTCRNFLELCTHKNGFYFIIIKTIINY